MRVGFHGGWGLDVLIGMNGVLGAWLGSKISADQSGGVSLSGQ